MRYRPFVVAGVFGLTLSLVAHAGEPDAGQLDALLHEGSLAKTRNPVPASFLLNEGDKLLTPEQRAAAMEQLRTALKVQTNSVRVMMQGVAEMMNSNSVKRQNEYAKDNSGAKVIFKSMVGMNAPPPAPGPQMHQEMKQAMIDPWVRGIEAARALEQAGDAQSAAGFYVNCPQFLEADWVPSACVDGILGLRPRRAGLVLNWMVDNADTVSITSGSGFGAPPPPKHGKPLPDRSALQLRLFALEGLGALIGGGQVPADAREQAFAKLLTYSAGKDNESFYKGVALGLGRSRDPRAVEPLRHLTKDSRPDVQKAAWRGLAVAFHDDTAVKTLRSELGDHDLEVQLRAAQALLEIDDDAAMRWVVETIGHRRTSDATQPDIRPEVVRELVILSGPHARQTLDKALAAGAGNDWIEAWVRVGLLELGDTGQMAAVESALAKEDWALDPRGFRSLWREIKPLVLFAAQAALSGGMAGPSTFQQVQRAIQLISDFANAERSRYLANADRRKAAIAQLRWQTADALAAVQPPGAAKVLTYMLDDAAPTVRLSAARALASLNSPDALDGLVTAFGRDYGEEGGVSRNAEVYGALLRAALIGFPQDPRTRKLLNQATGDKDPGVRFIALTALQVAS